jgi:hypothetical protein
LNHGDVLRVVRRNLVGCGGVHGASEGQDMEFGLHIGFCVTELERVDECPALFPRGPGDKYYFLRRELVC